MRRKVFAPKSPGLYLLSNEAFILFLTYPFLSPQGAAARKSSGMPKLGTYSTMLYLNQQDLSLFYAARFLLPNSYGLILRNTCADSTLRSEHVVLSDVYDIE